MMPLVKNTQSGFTLVELLVSIVILAVGLLGMAQLQITAIRTNSQSATITAANAIAQKVVEEIAAMPAGGVLFDAPGTGTWPGSPVTVAGAGSYGITYNITPLLAAGIPVSNVFKVEIVVTSNTEVANVLGNRTRTVTANTIKRAI